jgi:hypothetical protein
MMDYATQRPPSMGILLWLSCGLELSYQSLHLGLGVTPKRKWKIQIINLITSNQSKQNHEFAAYIFLLAMNY